MILFLPGITAAAVPHTFSAGTQNLASEVNTNFSDLDNRVTTLESSASIFPDFSGYGVPFSADGAPKNVVVLVKNVGSGLRYTVRSRYANSTEQVSIDGVLTIRPFMANYVTVETDFGNNITSISNRIETPDTSNYINSNLEYSTYDTATAAKTVTDDTTRELWDLCNSTGATSICIAKVVLNTDSSVQSYYDWSRTQTLTGPFTTNGITFNDVRLEKYTRGRKRIRAKDVGMVFDETDDDTEASILIYHRSNGVTGGSLAGTPFDTGQLLQGLFF